MRTTNPKTTESAFALLITLIVISVVLAIGLSLLNITLKQFTLSSIARDSEVAFHAADSGLECMQYHRSVPSTRDDLLNGGNTPQLSCAQQNPAFSDYDYDPSGNNHFVHHYVYRYDNVGSQDVCIETSMYLIDTRTATDPITYSVNEGLDFITCADGVVCTTIFSRGYNRACNDLDSIRTVQRELTIQY